MTPQKYNSLGFAFIVYNNSNYKTKILTAGWSLAKPTKKPENR